jgi:hypothetical protein
MRCSFYKSDELVIEINVPILPFSPNSIKAEPVSILDSALKAWEQSATQDDREGWDSFEFGSKKLTRTRLDQLRQEAEKQNVCLVAGGGGAMFKVRAPVLS